MYALQRTLVSHSPFVLMLAVTVWLTFGAASAEHPIAVLGLIMFGGTLAALYAVLISSVTVSFTNPILSPRIADAIIWIAGVAAIIVSILHYIWFDGFTLRSVGSADDTVAVALMRQNATASLPTWMMYANQIAFRCLFPIAGVLAVWRGKHLLAISILAFGLLYSICLLQKSGPILLLLPTILLLIWKRRYFLAVTALAVVIATVFALGFLANPHMLRSTPQAAAASVAGTDVAPVDVGTSTSSIGVEAATAQSASSVAPQPPPAAEQLSAAFEATSTLSNSLLLRVAVVPGAVAAEWFSIFPAERDFGWGCGYRFLAPLVDCEFQNYARIIYDDLYREKAAQGLQGTVNAASMMTAYANFGWFGLIASAALHAVIAWALWLTFARTPELLLPINASYIFLLSSGDFFTMLLSGGWGLAILLSALVLSSLPRNDAALRV